MATDVRRWPRMLLMAASACLVLLPAAPGGAQQAESTQQPEAAESAEYGDNFVRSPDSASNPVPQTRALGALLP